MCCNEALGGGGSGVLDMSKALLTCTVNIIGIFVLFCKQECVPSRMRTVRCSGRPWAGGCLPDSPPPCEQNNRQADGRKRYSPVILFTHKVKKIKDVAD